MTDAELRDDAVAELKKTTVGYVNKKWKTPPAGSQWEKGLKLLAQIGQASPPPPPAGIVTGTHWPEPNEYPQLKQIGYGFAVTTVQPGDTTTAKAKLDAAKAAGIQLIIGCYPEPYTWNGSGWSISAAGQASLNYLESRESEILGLFVFNEPYWVMSLSAAQLRSLRNAIRGVWPNAKVYHDIGQASFWAKQDAAKWGYQSGTLDLCGSWYYPFKDASVGTYPKYKSYGLQILQDEAAFIASNIGGGARLVWLAQSHAAPGDNLVYPTDAQIDDWSKAVRAALPSNALLSWYVWRQGMYPDYLANHQSQWPLTV